MWFSIDQNMKDNDTLVTSRSRWRLTLLSLRPRTANFNGLFAEQNFYLTYPAPTDAGNMATFTWKSFIAGSGLALLLLI